MNKQLTVTLKWEPNENGIIKLSFGDKFLEIPAKLDRDEFPYFGLLANNIDIESLKREILFLFDEMGGTTND